MHTPNQKSVDGAPQIVMVMPPLWARVVGFVLVIAFFALALLIAIPLAIFLFVVMVAGALVSVIGRMIGTGPRDSRRNVRVIRREE